MLLFCVEVFFSAFLHAKVYITNFDAKQLVKTLKRKIVDSATDILLAILYTPGLTGKVGEPIKGFTKLEKMMFLISKETRLKEIIGKDYKFEAYDYGPCAHEIYDDVEMLKDATIIKTTFSKSEDPTESVDLLECTMEAGEEEVSETLNETDTFRLTKDGEKIGRIIYDALDPEDREKLTLIKTLFNSKSAKEIVKYVYTKYPETTRRSRIKEEILR